ncbi:ribonuclease D [Candidatus Pelagibacter communis]|uniref:ribonuclease D n=1 Tax=Pelagibacter ubique TaxID=198252 RepID=UPI00094D8599|nr:ribonuclease D [Candidatus Pelagibacter ubique]|tara:strand:- start:1511 stop:2125 length:615 start_codon:yes stop_codon:yes gene_type:complete
MSNKIQLHKNDLPDDLKLDNNIIAVDGEFMGLNVRRDPLCLIQISTGNSDAHIIQFDRKNYNAPNLSRILSDSKITKIFHYGRADLAHIKYYLKINTNNILDTKIASKLARSYSDNHSLKTLIKEFLNIDISKQFQNSDFGGQLTSSQLKYCANDVIYLHKIHEELNKILERENRSELYYNCLKFLQTRVDLDLALFKDDVWAH